ncbi:HalOD1 output domain-containing protein [Natrinema soli]|uniref:HalOD1 output domain-containing protein n=1 Tax=Natrinema soli TaxID=1930624 RepID=A0ABD5SYU0_9EURY|nr:HalOD1 output domain-containing protein [Natrinema soli]
MVEGGDSVDAPSVVPPSQAVIETVAEAEGVRPTELAPPQYESLHAIVDPTALDALFADRPNGTNRPHGTVSFRFCDYHVTVDRDGTVTLEEPTEPAD